MLGLGRYNAVGSPIAALATRLEALTERLLHSWVLSEHRLDVSELDDDRCSVRAPAMHPTTRRWLRAKRGCC